MTKKEKFKKFVKDNKKKITIVGVSVIFVLAIVLIGTSLANPTEAYLKDQVVEGLSFENADLVVENGISKYTVEVYNDQKSSYPLKNIQVIFENAQGGTIATLTSYVGDTIETEKVAYLESSIDQELTDIAKVRYVITK